MKSEELEKLVNETVFPECKKILTSKGMAYSGKEDRLGNFKRISKTADVPIKKVWFTFFSKHVDAIASFVRGEYFDTELIEGRIWDAINYLCLLAAIITESRTKEE